METTERILREFRTIAVVGLSRDPAKAAHAIPVNPNLEQVLGERAYKTLKEVPEPIEVVLVFRPSPEAAAIAKDAVAIGAKALWLQQGIASEEARRIAESAGLLYVEDRCMGVERAVHHIVKK